MAEVLGMLIFLSWPTCGAIAWALALKPDEEIDHAAKEAFISSLIMGWIALAIVLVFQNKNLTKGA